jgi:hypothetical protein
MPATVFAAIAALEVILGRKYQKTCFPIYIIIFSL